MEKFLVDRDEVVAAIEQVIERYSSGKEFPTGVDHALALIKAEILIEILKIDAQKIEGIDLGKGDGKVLGD